MKYSVTDANTLSVRGSSGLSWAKVYDSQTCAGPTCARLASHDSLTHCLSPESSTSRYMSLFKAHKEFLHINMMHNLHLMEVLSYVSMN